MNNNFNTGDFVVLKDAIGVHILELYKTYKIISTSTNHRGDKFIMLDGYDESWNAKRFTKDLKPIRKKKLKKLKKLWRL
jgi:hypothetical protein